MLYIGQPEVAPKGGLVRIVSVEVEGYRSIHERVHLHFDPKTTVILGANDHGKTNLLEAMRHLNVDHPFRADLDLNWDNQSKDGVLPSILFELELEPDEMSEIKSLLDAIALSDFAGSKFDLSNALLDKIDSDATNLLSEESVLEGERAKLSASVEDQQSNKQRIGEISSRLSEIVQQRHENDEKYESIERELLEAAATEIKADFVIENGDSVDALDVAIDDLEKKHSGESETIAKLKRQVADARTASSEAIASGDAAQIKSTQTELSRLEKSLSGAQAALSGGRFGNWLGPIIQYVKSGKVDGSCEKDFDGGPAVPKRIQARRIGLNGEREIILPEEIDYDGVREVIEAAVPRVELINPVDKITDAVTRSEIEQPEFAFMRGVFYYAGLGRDAWDDIFTQDDVSVRRLDAASDQLNETLRQSWSQGRNLSFILKHNSGSKQIELYIKDPVVTKKYVRASRRSTGFTHFFTLKTILFSRQAESRARSYLWLFDEPGLYLHPIGQHDLLQVLETLAISNQIVYSTHSLFMINKNYPSRHRLLTKAKIGTRIDGKPHQGQWKTALDALGLSLPGTIIFASKILLVEGDSDPVFLNAILQKLIELKKIEIDLNPLAIISTGDSKNADALIRILSETATKPKIAALFDGDEGGKQRAKGLSDILRKQKIESKILSDDSTIEDHLIGVRSLFKMSLTQYIAKVAGTEITKVQSEIDAKFLAAFPDKKSSETKGVASWSRSTGREAGGLNDDPSPLGLAREYALLLADASPKEISESDLVRAVNLVDWLAKALELRPQVLSETQILDAT